MWKNRLLSFGKKVFLQALRLICQLKKKKAKNVKQTVLMLTTTKEKKKNILKSKVKIKVRPPDFGLLTCLMKKSPWIKDTRPKLVYLNTWSISHIIFRTTCKKEKIQ